ncbi:MAG TPA: hypothetical protein VFQ61_01760 [Polyangiaceae bacterium]|nr:hypothetical protein [Polyangiaceae bacterium]
MVLMLLGPALAAPKGCYFGAQEVPLGKNAIPTGAAGDATDSGGRPNDEQSSTSSGGTWSGEGSRSTFGGSAGQQGAEGGETTDVVIFREGRAPVP